MTTEMTETLIWAMVFGGFAVALFMGIVFARWSRRQPVIDDEPPF